MARLDVQTLEVTGSANTILFPILSLGSTPRQAALARRVHDIRVRILTAQRNRSIILTAAYTVRKETPLPQSLDDLQRERSGLQVALTQMDDLRPGSLVPRFRKCGKEIVDAGQQTNLSLRQTGFARPWPELFVYQRSGGQDCHQNHPVLRRGADTPADRRIQAVSRLNPRLCRGQRKSLRRATACDDRQCRARS